MFGVLRRNPLAVLLAVALHVIIVLFMVVGVDWSEKPRPIGATAQVVRAQIVDAKQLQGEIDKLKKAELQKKANAEAKRKAEQKKLADLEKRRRAEKAKLAKLKKERIAREKLEAKKKEEAKRKAIAEKKRKAELEKRVAAEKKKQAQEKKRLAELEKKRLADARAREAAEKKQREAEKKKRLAEEKKKAEAEKKRQAEIALKKKREAERQKKIAAEREAARIKAENDARQREFETAMQDEQDALEENRLIGAIQAKVGRNWLQPPGTSTAGLSCTVRVRLGGSGSVLLVNVVKSSGNGAFDRSVEAAVRKADPLPMPSSARLQAKFRNIEFVFTPDN